MRHTNKIGSIETAPARRPLFERGAVVFVVCLAAAFLTYASAYSNEFYNDDSTFLTDAKRLQGDPLAVFSISPIGWYRPLWSGYVWLLYYFFQLNPLPYFIIGVAIHGATGFLVWKVARAFEYSAGACWTAALAFITFYSHCEATLWMAAHNSSIVATLSLAAMLMNLSAIEKPKSWKFCVAPMLVLTALLTKETGVTALAWVPLAEWLRRGWRTFFTKEAIIRYALFAVAVAIFLSKNERVRGAASGEEGVMTSRVSIANITIERLVGAFLFLFSPRGLLTEDLNWIASAAAIALFFVMIYFARRDRIKDALFAVAAAMVALVPTTITMQQMGPPFRLYYFATAGAALCLALLYDCVKGRGARLAAAAVLLAYFAWNAWSLNDFNIKYYQPFSRQQTAFARQMEKYLPKNRPARLLLLEPPINNLFHLQRFLTVYQGVRERWTEQKLLPKDNTRAWLANELRGGAVALRWNGSEIVETTEFPPPFELLKSTAIGRARTEPELLQESAYIVTWTPAR